MSDDKQAHLYFPEKASDAQSLSIGALNERIIFRKLDWHLIPLFSALYLLSSLDRSNIGNAKIAGLSTDLNLTGLQYNLCAAVFFIPYCFFEIPSNMAMKSLRPSRWIPFIMFVWGSIVVSMAFVKNFHGLLIARVFLGLAEAGLVPGVIFALCLWYPRYALAQRMAIFFSAVTIAGSFGGLLAFAIENLDGVGGLAGWAWIFLLEGLLTVVVAVVAYFFMTDSPETAAFLTEPEREWIIQALKDDTQGLAKHFDWTFFWQAIRDPRSYALSLLALTLLVPTYAFALFLPTIIHDLGFSTSHAQLLSVPPYAAGCAALLIAGRLSDRLRLRGPFVAGGALVALAGYAILYATHTPGAGYAGTVVAAIGLYPTYTCALSWAGGNAGGDVKRGVVIGMVVGVGNLGGIAASFVYRAQDSPRYHLGHGVVIGCLGVAVITSVALMFEYARLNRAKNAYCLREGIGHEKEESFHKMGDESPLYRYTL